MSSWLAFAAQAGAVVTMTLLVPMVGIRMLAKSLADSPLAQRVNYRGQTVFLGLGIVWVFWVAGMVFLRYAGDAYGSDLRVFVALGALSPLVIAALLFGVVDDAYGTAGDRGFAGHFRAIAQGRLTTGMLKLAGIVLVSLAAAVTIPTVPASGGAAAVLPESLPGFWPWAGWTLVLGAVIALSANFVNLTDLRPGRALKVYGLGASALVVIAAALGSTSLAGTVLLAVALFGPLVAAWPLDAGEKGMLGDAGSNAAGAVLGFVAAWECGRSWPAVALAVLLLVVNGVSERWSFSEIISRNRPLSWLDDVGRGRPAVADKKSTGSSPHSETSDG